MANIGQYGYLNMLNWSLKAAAPATPSGVWCGLSLTAPNYSSSFEVGAGSGYARQSVTFSTAVNVAGSASASNVNAYTFGPFSSSAIVTGLFLADTVSSGAGSCMWYGNLAAARTPLANDQLVVNTNALIITLG
jgi:hypothetical protein